MKFLFTAPRFHTNQAPIVEGLTNKGHQVQYFVAFQGAVEEYTHCTPLKLKMSKCMQRQIRRISKTMTQSALESYIAGRFVPDKKYLKQVFLDYMPEIVICRENTPLTLMVNHLCCEYNIPCIMYDQQPYWQIPGCKTSSKIAKKRKSIVARILIKAHRMLNSDQRLLSSLRKTTGFPTVRMTPVEMACFVSDTSGAKAVENSYFVPFVGVPSPLGLKRTYMPDGKIRILCVGKYREYKNLPLLIEAISLIKDTSKISVTILGQASSTDEVSYYNEMNSLVDKYSLRSVINLKKNVPHSDMSNIYLEHDLFILPTKKECASISVIEAMSHGLAVISTNYNGTASYIQPGRSGYIFETGNAADLADKIQRFLTSDDVAVFGQQAYLNILDNYSFSRYYECLGNMLETEYHISI